MNCDRPIVISGSSITNDEAWPTWATWIRKVYKLTNVHDLSRKGLGNKTIILNAIKKAQEINDQSLMILLQLTSVDKWDWYVQNSRIVNEIKNEKHPPLLIHDSDVFGFWCTGSHFPLWKQYYKENYFSLNYSAFETLLMMQWFELLCHNNNWKYQIIFESPILSVTEQQLNLGMLTAEECNQKTLIDNSLCDLIKINFDKIYQPGLIGYACINELEWFDKKYKAHPGSYVHYCFAKDVIAPQMDHAMSIESNFQIIEQEAKLFQGIIKDR